MSNRQVSSRFSQDDRNPEQKRGLRIGRALERELHIDGTLERVDPVRGLVTATVDIGGFPLGVTTTDGSLWVIDGSGPRVTRVRS